MIAFGTRMDDRVILALLAGRTGPAVRVTPCSIAIAARHKSLSQDSNTL
jgi:hypothetical protein